MIHFYTLSPDRSTHPAILKAKEAGFSGDGQLPRSIQPATNVPRFIVEGTLPGRKKIDDLVKDRRNFRMPATRKCFEGTC